MRYLIGTNLKKSHSSTAQNSDLWGYLNRLTTDLKHAVDFVAVARAFNMAFFSALAGGEDSIRFVLNGTPREVLVHEMGPKDAVDISDFAKAYASRVAVNLSRGPTRSARNRTVRQQVNNQSQPNLFLQASRDPPPRPVVPVTDPNRAIANPEANNCVGKHRTDPASTGTHKRKKIVATPCPDPECKASRGHKDGCRLAGFIKSCETQTRPQGTTSISGRTLLFRKMSARQFMLYKWRELTPEEQADFLK